MNPIALVMIVRNEARCLARCLDSVRAHVDDMLVLDTGSTDGTPDIARRCGARVARFPWVDDFSAARNAALARVDAPWRLVLDADEWIASGAEALAELRSRPPEFLGLVRVDSQVSDERDQLQQAPSWLPRVLPRGVAYSGRIHEQPASTLPRQRLGLVIGHDGYLPAQMGPKGGRNRSLLLTALAERPGDRYLSYQLGKDCEVHGDFAQALPHYEAAWGDDDATASWRHDLMLRLMFTLKKLGRHEAALELAERELPRWQHSPDYFFTLGDVLLDAALARPAKAAEWLPLIERAWLRAIEIGERPDLPDSLRGRGSYLAAHNLAAFHASLGRAVEAGTWRERARRWRVAADDSPIG
jgi:glycosyltransferase involved in cell wall biosynthesis